MHASLFEVLILAAVAKIAVTAPTTGSSGPRQFSIQQALFARQSTPPTAANKVLQAYNKYANAGAKAPQTLLNGAKLQTGSVVATPIDQDTEYVCPVSAGGQTVYLDFDTGSSDLWTFSSLTPKNDSAGHHIYSPDKSNTSLLLKNQTFDIGYADGSGAKGVVYVDTVVIGGATATYQAVGAATSVASTFAGNKASDGLLGLSFGKLNTVKPTQQQTFFDNVASTLSRKLFAVDLKHLQPGSYDFGFINQQKFTGGLTYAPVDSAQGYWLVNVGGYSFGDSKKPVGNIGPAVMDTGTTLMYLPTPAVLAYYSQVPTVTDANGVFVVYCNATLPDFNNVIGGRTFTVPGKYINYSSIGTFDGVEYCLGGIQLAQGLPFNIYGDIFLKSFYAVYDQTQSKPRFGLATKDLGF